ncbi:MAG TPA: glutamate--tRNA ligase family protein, partial [Verrucomicrobiota bacterium]|nr:glutamate--tRNA ligase family protein [Verrucomicrobiota bacterium]
IGGPFAPYNQSERMTGYRDILGKLEAGGFIYPCTCSRKDIQSAVRAPHAEDDDEPIYPRTCREKGKAECEKQKHCWRFRVPDGDVVSFTDGNFGPQRFVAGMDFGDFVVWRQDDVPSYQLACVADDVAMQITEVARGADLIKSTARQLLLYRALGISPPAFYHCPLMTDDSGARLAKRHDALSLRSLRISGREPSELRQGWATMSIVARQ